jgi:16S rRNA (guanine966-N2)-methyltransferase
MRIISGILRNRQFEVPAQGLRPTKEMVREAVFSVLAARIPGARVLDLFAGSGALGLEAWSRGAACVTAVEKNSNVWKNLNQNFQGLESPGLGKWEAIRADVYEYLKRAEGSFEYDLIFADPPYEEADLPRLLTAVAERLASTGLLMFEMRSRTPADIPADWAVVKDKKYGGTRMLFLQRNGL